MNKILKTFLGLILIFVLVYFFLAQPSQIVGGNPGSYKQGDTVVAMSAVLYKSFNAIKPGDVVIIQTRNMDDIAQVVGIPGDVATPGSTYYLSNEKLEGVIPGGFYVVSFNNSDTHRVVPESQISKVVWGKI